MFRTKTGALAGVLVLLAAATAAAQPAVTIHETAPESSPDHVFTGPDPVAVPLTVGVGQAVSFAWSTADWAEFRVGWDVIDPADDNDPGWVDANYDPGLTTATSRTWSEGVHQFVLDARNKVDPDHTYAVFRITVDPGVPAATVPWSSLHARYRNGAD